MDEKAQLIWKKAFLFLRLAHINKSATFFPLFISSSCYHHHSISSQLAEVLIQKAIDDRQHPLLYAISGEQLIQNVVV